MFIPATVCDLFRLMGRMFWDIYVLGKVRP
jgi:hypothetical protein